MIHMLVKLKNAVAQGCPTARYAKKMGRKWLERVKKNGVWEGTVRGYLPVGRALRLERLYDR